MALIINPGARIPTAEPQGWTNTYEGAVRQAQEWLARMRGDALVDVELVLPGIAADDGRWAFGFRHTVTGVVVELETHGIDNYEAFTKQHIFGPKVYWNGSSTGEPQLSDWAAPGFEPRKTFAPAPASQEGGKQ